MCGLPKNQSSEDVPTPPAPWKRGLRDVLRELRDSLNTGGIDALHRAHLGCLQRSLRYRLLFGFSRLFLPITPLLDITNDLERLVGELGVHGASRAILARPPVPWEAEMPPQGELEIRQGSMIVYGTHGSILTPILLAAAINRADLKMIAASYTTKLGPNIAGCSFPVYAAQHVSVKRAGGKGLVPRALGWIASKSAEGRSREAVMQQNRVSLARAAEHVRQGGGLIIVPESRNHRETWRLGLGRLVAELAQHPGSGPSYLVPWDIRGASITGIFQLLSHNPLARRLGRRRFRRPARIAFGEPIAVTDVVAVTGVDPAEITAYLERDYRERFSKHRRSPQLHTPGSPGDAESRRSKHRDENTS